MSNGLPSLPTFANKALLGATHLNAIGQVQSYIHQYSGNKLNFPIEYMTLNVRRHVFHRHRFLHWELESSVSATLTIDGTHNVSTSGTSGYVDLDSYALPVNKAYTVEWTSGAVNCVYMAEWPTSTPGLTLPSASPSFGSVANATDLNIVSNNTKYLLDNLHQPQPAFTSRLYANRPDIHWWMTHQHRYLYFNAEVHTSGLDLRLKINGTQLWSDVTDGTEGAGGTYYFYRAWVDLHGTDHSEYGSYTGSGMGSAGHVDIANGSSLGLTVGTRYDLRLYFAGANLGTTIKTFLICETPNRNLLG